MNILRKLSGGVLGPSGLVVIVGFYCPALVGGPDGPGIASIGGTFGSGFFVLRAVTEANVFPCVTGMVVFCGNLGLWACSQRLKLSVSAFFIVHILQVHLLACCSPWRGGYRRTSRIWYSFFSVPDYARTIGICSIAQMWFSPSVSLF